MNQAAETRTPAIQNALGGPPPRLPVKAEHPGSSGLAPGLLRITSALLIVLAIAWAAVGMASRVPAVQAQAQADQAAAALQGQWDSVALEEVPAQGQAWATVTIPAIGLQDMVVLEGTSAEQINVGVGHYTGTEFPWDGTGNVALAGHRTGWGEPFNRLDELAIGDEVVIETGSAAYTYTVTGSTVVDPSQTWVLGDVPPEVTGASGQSQILTLTTCEGDNNQQRLVVWGELTNVASKS